MQPHLSPAQQRHLQRYADGDDAFKNTRSEYRLLALGFIVRCDQIVRYTGTVTWTIYKARITPEGRRYLSVTTNTSPPPQPTIIQRLATAVYPSLAMRAGM